MFSDCADIGIKRLSTQDWWWISNHRLLFCCFSVTKVEFVQEFRYRNSLLFTGYDTFYRFFKALGAHWHTALFPFLIYLRSSPFPINALPDDMPKDHVFQRDRGCPGKH